MGRTELVKVVSNDASDSASLPDVLSQFLSTQIEEPVFSSDIFVRLASGREDSWRQRQPAAEKTARRAR